MPNADDLKQARSATAQAVDRHLMLLLGLWLLSLVLPAFPDVCFLETAAPACIPVAGATSFKMVLVVLPLLMVAVRVRLEVLARRERVGSEELEASGGVPVRTASRRNHRPIQRVRFPVLFLSVPTGFAAATYQGMVFVDWGAALLAGTLLATGILFLPPANGFAAQKVGASIFLAILVAAAVYHHGEFRRPFRLDRADLRNADLRRADLRQASLYRADLRGAVLANSDLSGAMLVDANLTRANLDFANLTGADLESADLTTAHLRQANLATASFSTANLTRSVLLDADLTGARLGSADLTGAVLLGADLTDADLSSANLTRAQLARARLARTRFRNADLTRAGLLQTADLTQSQLDAACGDENTRLPEGLTITPCQVRK